MRFKRRYFCVEILFQDDSLSSKGPTSLETSLNKIKLHKLKHTNLTETIHGSIEKFYGDYGMATLMPSFSVIYFNSITNIAIMRTARDLKDKFHNLLMFTAKLAQFDVTFRVVHVSGSIKKCKKFLGAYCQRKLHELIVSNKNISEINNDENKMAVDVYEKLIEVANSNDNLLNMK